MNVALWGSSGYWLIFFAADSRDVLLASGSQDSYIRMWRVSLRDKHHEEYSETGELKLKDDCFAVSFQGLFWILKIGFAMRPVPWCGVHLSECLSHSCILSKWVNIFTNFFHHRVATPFYFLSASLYFSKRGAYWDRLCRDVVGRWSVGCHARALWPNGAS